ncbi:MAG: prepilin-type N-terminal cleavage/methylation domain-containing protein [Planctomycetaceae bacterium]
MIPRRTISTSSGRHACRGGFTLLELMVVLGILATISAMAARQLMSLMRESTVATEADRIREVMAEARRYAIDTGIDYEFRFEVNGPGVVVLPSENELNVDDAGNSTTTEKYFRISLELPEDFRLHMGKDANVESESLAVERFGDLNSATLSRKTWSTPVMFRFDGTAQDFTLHVADKSLLTAEVSVRGLTGTIRTSQVYQEDL